MDNKIKWNEFTINDKISIAQDGAHTEIHIRGIFLSVLSSFTLLLFPNMHIINGLAILW
jgi:hypothetical protein